MSSTYRVKNLHRKSDITVEVPGSKSITNRALLLAALSDGKSRLIGCGMSDDSRVFTHALISLGFSVEYVASDLGASEDIIITGEGGTIPNKTADVYVGSAGTAARFLTAMMGLSDGVYKVTASEQMKVRPMKELVLALEELGASFDFDEEKYQLPFTVYGRLNNSNSQGSNSHDIPLNIDKSSQFLSALLLCGPMVKEGFSIYLTGKRQAKSYVKISEKMMHAFGYERDLETGNDRYEIRPDAAYKARDYYVEPDVSAACYFYAFAALNGGRAVVKGVDKNNTQGDMKLLSVLEEMGCEISLDEASDIVVSKKAGTVLRGIDIDMSDFSDQTMTVAVIAPFADSPTTIRGVAHIRGQESDRISAIATELTKVGVTVEEYPDGLKIYPMDNNKRSADEVLINTYNDHRMAMSFAVLGTALSGVIIDNPKCCEKTFAEFFDILDEITK